MRYLRLFSLLAGVILIPAALAFAQADAQKAYQEAKAAYAAGKFEEAREAAQKASQTDTANPEVFLLLGQAQYQLGQIDKALDSWKKTLALAPREPFAAKMVELLRAQRAGVEEQIKFVEAMLAEKLYGPVLVEAEKCLADKAIPTGARAKLLTLEAESLVRTGRPLDAQKLLREVLVLYPGQADHARTSLILGVAKLSVPETSAEGVAILQKTAGDQPETSVAKSAQYELALFALHQGITPEKIAALSQWIAANPRHPQALDAKKMLIFAYVTLSRQGGKPTAESKLGDADQKALTLVGEVLAATVRADQAAAVLQPIFDLLEKHYLANGANDAAIAGLETLLKSPLNREQRLQALRLVAVSKNALAMRWLEVQSRLGKLPAAAPLGQLPPALKEVVSALQAIAQENPAEPVWQMQLKLAADVQALAKTIAWPEKIEQMRGPEAWAIELALPTARANSDPAAVQAAVELLTRTATELYLAPQPRDLKDLPLLVSRQVVEATPLRHPAWAKVMQWQCELLAKSAQRHFEDNIKEGNAAANAKLSEQQKELLQTLERLVREKADMAGFVRNFLAVHLQPWKNADQWRLVEEAQRELAKALPANEKLLAEIDIVNLWIEQADRKQHLLLQAGFSIPKALDPLHQKALLRLYELQAGLSDDSSTLANMRQILQNVVTRYKALEYYDVAEAAIQIKAETPTPTADEFAAFQLLMLQTEQAQRAFNDFVKQYHAPDKLHLLPEHKNLLGVWQMFIADHPASTLASQAVTQILNLGRLYEQQGAFKAAAGIYADFAKFADGQKLLSQKVGDRPSMAERASLAEAAALDAQARKMLLQWAADRKPDATPPDKLSEEFATAVAAYKNVIDKNPKSSLAGEAINKIMAVASEYAKLSAWQVVDGIYADLLGSKLELSHPERLEFARGVCQLGAVLPDHARQILTAISLGGEQPSGRDGSGAEMLAGGDYFGGAASPLTSPTDGIAGVPGLSNMAPSVSAKPAIAGGGFGGAAGPTSGSASNIESEFKKDYDRRDSLLLAMVRQEEMNRAQRVAQLRAAPAALMVQPNPQQGQQAMFQPPASVLSDVELARQEKALAAAYEIFKAIRANYAQTAMSEQARGEILVMAAHWRELREWQRAASLMSRFLGDNPRDPQLPHLRLEIARDRLAYAAKPLEKRTTRQEMLVEVEKRFDAARAEINKLLADFPTEKELQQNGQWDIAMSYLTQARTIDAVSPTLAQGQYVRTAKELRQIAEKYPDHLRLGEIPQILWNIGQELDGRGYNEEAIDVWGELVRFDPLNGLAGAALLRTAQTYQQKLKRPLRAAEAYQELNFIRGGSDVGLQNAVFQIGFDLKNERRWVEALHVLETFVDSFPRHPQAGLALTMTGQIHQANEAWPDAIAAYRRVIDEYPGGQWVQEAKWSIAECTINLSQWKEAADAYRDFIQAYPRDGKVGEANRRIDILKDLARYQGLINEKDQRKAFDAQYQIGEIVRRQLNNPVKAIIEYRKVYADWPQSYLAADALFAVGETYLALGELKKARENLMLVAKQYPTSPSAGNAMFLVGKSYEDEADKLGKVTRAEQLERSKEVAQREAYWSVQGSRADNQLRIQKKVAELKAAGKGQMAEVQEAANAAGAQQFDRANVEQNVAKAFQQVETMTALELADRQDKVNAALRMAVDAYAATAKIAGGNKADSALLAMATIYDQRLKDSKAAMQTWLEIVRQFSGTNVAEDASWKIAQYYEREGKYAEAVDAYQAFLRNYRRSPNAGAAQFAIAENYEHLGEWVKAMDSYTNYITNFANGPLANKAKEQINWIKTYRL